MSRFLFVVPPLIGHTRPTIAVGAELLARGHDVAWAGDPTVVGPLAPTGSGLFEAGTLEVPDSQGLRGLEAMKFLWDEALVPLARAMRPELDAAIAAFDPDVLVVDQHALAGALAARRHGLPWVTSATTTVDLLDPLDGLPKLKEWVQSRMDLLVEAGEDAPGDLRFSDLLVLIYSTETLLGGELEFPPHYAFVGPSLPHGSPVADFPWEWFDERCRHVLVSLGTVTQEGGRDFLQRAVDAFPDADAGIRLVVVAPDGTFDEVPAHVLVRPKVPQLALLPFFDAVVSHAGHNTVCESLAHGLPLVLAPIRDDQPAIAQQVVTAGAGIRVKYGRVRPEGLRAAVLNVLDDPSYRTAAESVRESFATAGGASAAADRLEEVLSRAAAGSRPAALPGVRMRKSR
jgi:UDP:flavonoid glycosyltransferase YjiC (YdhE family)